MDAGREAINFMNLNDSVYHQQNKGAEINADLSDDSAVQSVYENVGGANITLFHLLSC